MAYKHLERDLFKGSCIGPTYGDVGVGSRYDRQRHEPLAGFVRMEMPDMQERMVRMNLAVLTKYRILRTVLKHGEVEIDGNVYVGKIRGARAMREVADMLRYMIEFAGGSGRDVETPNGKVVRVTPDGIKILEDIVKKYPMS